MDNTHLSFIWLIDLKHEWVSGLLHMETEQNFVTWPNTGNQVSLKKEKHLFNQCSVLFWDSDSNCMKQNFYYTQDVSL